MAPGVTNARADRWFHGMDGTVVTTGLALFAVLVTSGLWAIQLGESRRGADLHSRVVSETSTIRANLERRLSSSLNLARGIRAYLVANPDLGDPERLEVMLESVHEQGSHVRNIGLAPDNVVEVVVPRDGNEAAIGLRYADVPEQFDAVRRARETDTTVVAGPLDLVQGGRGLIARTPVHLRDGSYWGVVSMVIDIDEMLSSVSREVAYAPLDWAVRAVDSPGAPPIPVVGDQGLFAAPIAVTQHLAVPGGSWELAAVAEPHLARTTLSPTLQRLIVLLGATLVAGLGIVAAEERRLIKRLSVRDPLTSLPNRRLLDDRLEQAIHRAERSAEHLSVLFIDLDGFKQVNDQHGHHAGDHVLLTVGDRLRALTRGSDTIARLGGDEFVALLSGHRAEDDAFQVALKLRAAVSEPIHFEGNDLVVGASVGIAHCPRHGVTPDDLLHAADAAMYRVKDAGKDAVAVADDLREVSPTPAPAAR